MLERQRLVAVLLRLVRGHEHAHIGDEREHLGVAAQRVGVAGRERVEDRVGALALRLHRLALGRDGQRVGRSRRLQRLGENT